MATVRRRPKQHVYVHPGSCSCGASVTRDSGIPERFLMDSSLRFWFRGHKLRALFAMTKRGEDRSK